MGLIYIYIFNKYFTRRKMLTGPSRKKLAGQAAAELAVFGSLIIAALGFLISMGNNMSEQMTLQQQAFRMALWQAYDKNGSVNYTIIKHYRSPNLFGGFKQGNRQSATASASVLWCVGDVEEFNYYQINDDLITVPSGKKIYNIETSAGLNYNSSDQKIENTAQIFTNRQSNLTDTVTTRLIAEDGSVYTYTQGLDTDGRYRMSAAGTNVTYGRSWTTTHN